MTPKDHQETRRLGAEAAHMHVSELLLAGDLSPEGAESYALGMIEGVVGILTGPLGIHPPLMRFHVMAALGHGTLRETA